MKNKSRLSQGSLQELAFLDLLAGKKRKVPKKQTKQKQRKEIYKSKL